MTYPTPHHHPRLIEQRRDDDTPGAPPWPWQPEPSGQARRGEHQRVERLEPSSGR